MKASTTLAGESSQIERSPEAESLRQEIYKSMKEKPASGEAKDSKK